MKATPANLYLIPTTLGEAPPLEVLPLLVKKTVERIDHYVVEHEKSARRFIKAIVPRKPQAGLHFYPLNKFTDPAEIPRMLTPCKNGFDMGVMSDAGCPGIADPGAAVVTEAHRNNIRVVPLVGPSSVVLALMASGLNGQHFAFNGYLPIDAHARKKELKYLERVSIAQSQSQLFIETPYRNNQLLDSMRSTLNGSTHLCVACDITLPTEYIKTATVHEWQKIKVDLSKRPTLFIVQGYG